jgi:hypothetical protein
MPYGHAASRLHPFQQHSPTLSYSAYTGLSGDKCLFDRAPTDSQQSISRRWDHNSPHSEAEWSPYSPHNVPRASQTAPTAPHARRRSSDLWKSLNLGLIKRAATNTNPTHALCSVVFFFAFSLRDPLMRAAAFKQLIKVQLSWTVAPKGPRPVSDADLAAIVPRHLLVIFHDRFIRSDRANLRNARITRSGKMHRATVSSKS